MKGKAAVSVPSDKRRLRRPAESMAVVKPAEGAARCSNYIATIGKKSGVCGTLFSTVSHMYLLAYLITCSLITSSFTTTLGRSKRASD